MKHLLLLSLVCTNFVMGQKYDKGFIAKNIKCSGDFTDILHQNYKQLRLNKYYTKVLYEALRNTIKPNDFDKEIVKQFYEHVEECDPFVIYPSNTRRHKGDKELLKTCLNKQKKDDFVTIYYKITPESPLYEIVSNKHKETEKNEIKPERTTELDVISWTTYNTRCEPYLGENNNFFCSSTFFAEDYLEIIKEFEKNSKI
jgi:hypothetical protein